MIGFLVVAFVVAAVVLLYNAREIFGSEDLRKLSPRRSVRALRGRRNTRHDFLDSRPRRRDYFDRQVRVDPLALDGKHRGEARRKRVGKLFAWAGGVGSTISFVLGHLVVPLFHVTLAQELIVIVAVAVLAGAVPVATRIGALWQRKRAEAYL